MKRSSISNEDVAEWKTLCWAAHRAALGKRDRNQVNAFFAAFDKQICKLHHGILDGTLPTGAATRFQVFDPKPRTIHAPLFTERVLHHAVMRHVGPVLDRSLIDDTFACRVGKGAIAAVARAQHHARRYPWYAKLDVQKYFASINHAVLFRSLQGKFKDDGLLNVLYRIIDAHHASPGVGLPIGALTSQYFANFYLSRLDRFLVGNKSVRAIVRYMDDVVFWCSTKAEVQHAVNAAHEFLDSELRLRFHPNVQINRSATGLTVCSYRVLPGCIRLTRRRRHLYAAARARWERRFLAGRVSASQLQSGYAAALSIVLHADSLAWRREQLRRNPVVERLE